MSALLGLTAAVAAEGGDQGPALGGEFLCHATAENPHGILIAISIEFPRIGRERRVPVPHRDDGT